MNATRVARAWLPVAAATTILCLLVYASVQQTYRANANDPQIQLAEDAAHALAAGAADETVIPAARVDIAQSLEPFVAVFDGSGRATGASGLLAGAAPSPPAGLFEQARRTGQHSVTWMPRPDVRVAAVFVAVGPSDGRVVMAGRSLREVEVRVGRLAFFCVAAWIAALAGSLALALLLELWPGKNP